MVILYLVRHGKAEGSHPQGDRHRALSAEGRHRIATMVERAAERGFGADLALSSPYLRAVQTRDLFAPALGPSQWETTPAFTPDADPLDALDELQTWESEGFERIAVFTHNPFVTALAGMLTIPSAAGEVVFHTPTILALEFDHGLQRRMGRPLWTLNP